MKRLAPILAFLLALPVIVGPAAAAPSFTFQCADPSGLPTTLCDVWLDPNVHGGSKGTLLYHASAAVKAMIPLPAGDHKLAVVGAARGSTGTNTSVLVMDTDPGSACQSGWAPLGYQSWWSDTGQDPVFGSRHAHINGICLPVNNRIVSGTQTFRFEVELHNQPKGARLTRVRVTDGSTTKWSQTSGLPAIDANGNAKASFSVTLDLSKWATGRREFRWGVYVTQPNGFVQLLSSRSEICVRSCSPAYRSGTYQGNGSWYRNDSIGYEDTRIWTPFPVSP